MTFIITVVSLLIERFFDWGHIRQWRWFTRYQLWLSTRLVKLPSYVILLISLLPLLLVVGLINLLLSHVLFGVLKLVFGIIVLMYCLGPKNFWAQVYICMTELNKENPAAGELRVKELLGITLAPHSDGFHLAFARALFLEANRRVFAPLFWFVLLGPVGAVLYRSIDLSRLNGVTLSQSAAKAEGYLDWLPVRLYTFLFALAGHFAKVLPIWRKGFFLSPIANDTYVSECGIAAIDPIEANQIPEQDTLSLLDRVFVIWLVILAIVILV